MKSSFLRLFLFLLLTSAAHAQSFAEGGAGRGGGEEGGDLAKKCIIDKFSEGNVLTTSERYRVMADCGANSVQILCVLNQTGAFNVGQTTGVVLAPSLSDRRNAKMIEFANPVAKMVLRCF
jgi:hypothetical protein